jgi:aminocarboxymuconate-semialdehyde decarboxylase
MRSVDIHTHILPPEIPRWAERFGYGGFIQLEHTGPCSARMLRDDGTFFRDVESNCWDPAARLSDCDACDVELQVLSTVPVMFSYWAQPQHGLDVARFLNDHVAGIVQSRPSRFAGLGTLPMQAPDLAIHELERCMQLGLSGVQIGSHVNDWNLSAPELFPVFEAAERLGAAVFVHPWDMMGQAKMQKYWLPWLVGMPAEVSLAICSMIFGGVLERLPKLRVAFAHGGGAFPITLGRIQHGFEARPDLCAVDNPYPPTKYVDRIYVDSLVHDPRALRYVLETFGPHRVALGSDYPFPLGEARPGEMIRAMDLPPDAKERLLRGTALEWLGR